MTYMIIERFHEGKVKKLYQRFDEKGRMFPEGLKYINSWIDEDVKICFQVMESPNKKILKDWIAHWEDLADFEIIPVINSEQAKMKVFKK